MNYIKRVLIFLTIILFTSCGVKKYYKADAAMSTVVSITIYTITEPDWNKIFGYIEQLSVKYNYREEHSPIRELNNSGILKPEDYILNTIKTALEISESSNGAFDPTILPLMQLWDFDSGGKVPTEQEILKAQEKIDYKALRVDENGVVYLSKDFGIDLGGIAKGAIVDKLSEYLNDMGYENFLIEAGGDLLICGKKPDKKKWTIGIRHPREKQDYICVIQPEISEQKVSIVTSGDYERFFTVDKKKYHHIINPETGFPADDLISVSILTDSCTKADALSTAAFVLGLEKGYSYIEEMPDAEGLLIKETESGLEIMITSGFPISEEDLNNKSQ